MRTTTRLALASLCLAAGAAPARAQQATAAPATTPGTPVSWARVTYISGATVYVDAGTRAGLREKARLEVVRGGQVVAALVVDFISSTRSACSVARTTAEPAVGDSVRFVPEVSTDQAVPAPGGPVRATAGRRREALRGRVGLRYVTVDPGGGRPTWTQPAADLRLDGHHLGGTPLGLVVDVRAYRERSGATGRGAGASTRVYQGLLEWEQAGGPVRLGVGRQLAPALSTMGIFDGVTLELNGRHVDAGVVGGAQPDAASFGLSSVVREYGAYVQAHNATGGTLPWSVTLGGIGSYDRGNIDREFAYVQMNATSRHLSLFATQELDVNRGWKAAVEGSSTTPTSTFAMLRLAPVDAVSLTVGYDNRRSIRLYRDFVDPEMEFDDAFRQGAWAGLTLSPGSHLRISTDARRSQGGAGGAADTWTGAAGVYRLTRLGIGAQIRASRYAGAVAEGELRSGTIELNPWDRFHLAAGGGRRVDTRPLAGLSQRQLSWNEVNADVAVGRSLFLMLSAYRERGDQGTSTQGYAAISWRF